MAVTVLDDRNLLMRAAADRIVGLASSAIATRGRFDWALAGGSTPEALYRLLASPGFASRVDWSRVCFFWGDERCVPPDHRDSNYRMARAALLDVVEPPASNIHRMPAELEPPQAAAAYEAQLERHFEVRVGEGLPSFDLILLGMGTDGHTASLFPGSPGLEESRRWVVANPVESLGVARLTLTFPVIDAAANVLFLVAGADKAERLEQVLGGAPGAEALPARRVRPGSGALEWFVDAAAAARLGGSS